MPSLPEQPERLDLRSHDIAGDKFAQLLELFPEARTEDDQIDFDQLRRALGGAVDPGKERYGLTWPGKADCFKTIQTPSLGTLLPASDESVNWDTTENLIIEGDNLEVLKLLQKSYLGKVKMIYIDPPYNTGNDFIYPDDYAESLKTYLQYTGQVDAEGRRFSTNTDTDGRFHSKWLNMMYPRLYLARNLLRDDGVIFISIDDREISNLRRVCDDIFGEDRFVGTIKRRAARKTAFLSKSMSDVCDYVVIYSRGDLAGVLSVENAADDTRPVFNAGNKPGTRIVRAGTEARAPDGTYEAGTYALKSLAYTLESDLIITEGRTQVDVVVSGPWRVNQRLLDKTVFVTKNGGFRRYVLDEEKEKAKALSDLLDDPVAYNEAGSEEAAALFGEAGLFDNPKPVGLVSYLVRAAGVESPDDLVLDFFAGSGTTAHAVLDFNAQDGGNRRFILVQLPEPTDREDYPTIADITKERVRRVVVKLDKEKGEADGQDRGFRVFKLAESSFNVWDAQGSRQLDAFEEQLRLHVDNVRDERSADDVLFELLLKSGYPLSATIGPLELAGKRVFSVADGALLVCLDRGLNLALMRAVAERKPERFVVLDEGFAGNDQLKANAVQIFKAADVTFRTV